MTSQGQMPLLHNVWGPLELLLFNIPIVITEIDFVSNTITWVDYASILEDLQITHDQFLGMPPFLLSIAAVISRFHLDISILAGFDMISTFPPVQEQVGFQSHAVWKAAYEMVKQHGSGFNVISAFAQSPSVAQTNYKDQFLRVRAAIEHHVILDRNVKVRSPLEYSIFHVLSSQLGTPFDATFVSARYERFRAYCPEGLSRGHRPASPRCYILSPFTERAFAFAPLCAVQWVFYGVPSNG